MIKFVSFCLMSVRSFSSSFVAILIFTSMAISACESASSASDESPQKESLQHTSTSEATKETDDLVTAPKPVGFPRLTESNAVEFLTQYGKDHPENRVKISTDFGDIMVELFDDTPLHRANFIYLVNRGYYSPTEVLRVIKGFMIQSGNSEEPEAAADRLLIGEYCIPQEMTVKHPHFRGALAMSRTYEGNPEKCSSAYDFYIVQGSKYHNVHIFQAEQEKGITYTETQKSKYKNDGGAIHLDMEHTVFGRVVSGIGVVDKIAEVEVDQSNWPIQHVGLSMEVLPYE